MTTEYNPQKVSGYIINQKIGFLRNKRGEFCPTELKSGMGLYPKAWWEIVEYKYNGVFNLLNAYKAFVEFGGYEIIDKALSDPSKKMRKCMKIIKNAYETKKKEV